MSTWLLKKNLDSILRMSWVAHFFHLDHAHLTLSIQHLEKDLRHCRLTLTVSSVIYFLLKLYSARREDYACLESVTNVSAAYTMKHTETRWFLMKYVCIRVLEQWKILKEYFLKLLPKDKKFKQRIVPTSKYKRIKTALESVITEPYIAFCAFTTQDFETFLVPFQNNQPMIHILYPAMYKLVSDIMSKFIKKNTNHKSLKYIDIGVTANT